MSRYQLWLHENDEDGKPLDPEILKAAYEIGSTFFLYRQNEIRCESLTNSIVQAAVEAASRAKHNLPIENSKAYLASVFTRKVNRFIARQEKTVSLDQISVTGSATLKKAHDESVERRLSILEIMDCMDDETRRVSNLRFQGYSMNEIAARLSVKRDCLAARYVRGIARARIKAENRFQKRRTG